MSYRRFVREVARRAQEPDSTVVERQVTEVLRALGQRLCDIDARAVAAQLPPSLADPFLSAALGQTTTDHAPALLQDPHVVRAACRVLAEMLDEQARAHLRMQPLTALFVD